ncbi:ubiquitin carboxyl-terminal hydrolase 37-like [Artemia franciscana]|uniref:ubiquitin carboxyl-terminal hydrolase 37-like n=1 Tax=Artemia franciscana TaxID=6661 RepID=UPI0032DB4D75
MSVHRKTYSRSSRLVESALKEAAKREGKLPNENVTGSPQNVFQAFSNGYARSSQGTSPCRNKGKLTPRSLFSSPSDKENSPNSQAKKLRVEARSPSPQYDDWFSNNSPKLPPVRTYKSKLSSVKKAYPSLDMSKSKILSDKTQNSPVTFKFGSPVRVDLDTDPLSLRNHDEDGYAKRTKLDPREIGFDNLGNTCYINATMQCLLSLSPLISDLSKSCDTRPRNKLIDSFFELVQARESGYMETTKESLRKLHLALGVLDEEFAGYRMQDANELIIRLFDYLKTHYDAYNKGLAEPVSVLMTPESTESDSDDEGSCWSNNPIRSNFEFKLVEEFLCAECGKKGDVKKQISDSLWLPVTKEEEDIASIQNDSAEKLETFVDNFTLEEALGVAMKEERENGCDNCGKTTKFVAESKFLSLPRVLMIQLKRYVYCDGYLNKLSNPITITPLLDISAWMASSTKFPPHWPNDKKLHVSSSSNPELLSSFGLSSMKDADSEKVASCAANGCQYKLFGVIQHIGTSAHSGHYIAYISSPSEDRWRCYDDTNVTEVSLDHVIGDESSKNAYILFYVQDFVYQEMEQVS